MNPKSHISIERGKCVNMIFATQLTYWFPDCVTFRSLKPKEAKLDDYRLLMTANVIHHMKEKNYVSIAARFENILHPTLKLKIKFLLYWIFGGWGRWLMEYYMISINNFISNYKENEWPTSFMWLFSLFLMFSFMLFVVPAFSGLWWFYPIFRDHIKSFISCLHSITSICFLVFIVSISCFWFFLFYHRSIECYSYTIFRFFQNSSSHALKST